MLYNNNNNNNNNSLFSPFMVHGYINSYKSKKDGGDWLPEIIKVNRNRQLVVHVERLILGRTHGAHKTNTDTHTHKMSIRLISTTTLHRLYINNLCCKLLKAIRKHYNSKWQIYYLSKYCCLIFFLNFTNEDDLISLSFVFHIEGPLNRTLNLPY